MGLTIGEDWGVLPSFFDEINRQIFLMISSHSVALPHVDPSTSC